MSDIFSVIFYFLTKSLSSGFLISLIFVLRKAVVTRPLVTGILFTTSPIFVLTHKLLLNH